MFPDWKQAKRRTTSWLSEVSASLPARIGVAVFFVFLHLALFSRAGHQRLGLPFNSAPNEAPYFSDPDAPATVGYPRQPHRWSRLIVSRLDAQHYIGTSVRNVTACPKDPSGPDWKYLNCGLGWLPAYGIVGGIVSRVTGLADDLTLMILSIIAALAINLMLTSETLIRRLGRTESWGTLVAFNLYPAAFYVVTPYTEAATIALSFGGFLMLSREKYIWSGLLVGASTALRISAGALSVGLGCALLYAAWERRKANHPQWWRPLIAIPLAGWGQVATMVFLKIYVGDYRAFFRARHAFGDEHNWGRLFDIKYYVRGFGGQDMDVVFLVAVVAIMLLIGREVLKQFTRVEAVYLVVASGMTVILSIVAPLQYWGITRYLMLCPLGYLCMGTMAKKHTALFVMWCVLCLAFYWHIELCGYISQGNPHICPCLGRMEFTMPFGS